MDGVERMGIEADHSNMCKFETKTSPGYTEVAEGIKRYASDAPDTITKRWPQERKTRLLERKAEAEEIFPSKPDFVFSSLQLLRSLTSLDSVNDQPEIDGTPKTVSTETFSRGRSQRALPAPSREPRFEFVFDGVEERDVEMAG